ncbi:hypothetical protein CPAR01_06296 [Colletotrichum paranaense]|uniref:Uncharacterized protein n=5 Tax=Colletotrichum acutatum species complex TaxID=2707335 RepID=A0A9P9X8U9_9PEZI|nr:uncharacterized protein CLUP02_11457 [Colletotrichum lupini]XP_060315069.1 uncharacterized protein CCOS01_05116 [Colletotrichum costaricense]XP_060349443.1 uncharacterized protein CPAR01_06296 [Colletotrichum paranaense]XP_060372766.1 uncharacterized protein CTAM01_16661 [Colletotrichum tamarilloi]XP_060392093.1 uncharacterized protein CABS01_15213 [Colletotrichum abscissum]KAI3542381.1 hypothetical protein CABS02_10444 [Colletotrichum abscissum]KAK1471143.1 hypothetical protein CTAM01_166
MPSTLKIALLAFATLVAAVPPTSNNDDGNLFVVEKRCEAELAKCNKSSDCCGPAPVACSYVPKCGDNRCVSRAPGASSNPTCL